MELHFRFIGILLVLLALMHIGFPKRFNWRHELSSLSLLNRQMMQVHTFFIALVVGGMGLFSFTQAQALSATPLGKTISLYLGIFWLIRFVFQHFVYAPKLWRGKAFETSMHILFTILWIYFSTIFIYNWYL
jgi:hypothetical protein